MLETNLNEQGFAEKALKSFMSDLKNEKLKVINPLTNNYIDLNKRKQYYVSNFKIFEIISEGLYKKLLEKDFDPEKTKISRNKKITGRSGANHEIDILIEISTELKTFKIAVECKYLTRKVSKQVVAGFVEVLNDLNITNGCIISKLGYQTGAVKLAFFHGIRLDIMKVPDEEENDTEDDGAAVVLLSNAELKQVLLSNLANLVENNFYLFKKNALNGIVVSTNIITHGNLIEKLNKHAGSKKYITNRSLNALLDSTTYALNKGQRVSLRVFGSFSVSKRAAQTGRNPKTRQEIKIPASKVVKFKPYTKPGGF